MYSTMGNQMNIECDLSWILIHHCIIIDVHESTPLQLTWFSDNIDYDVSRFVQFLHPSKYTNAK